MSRSYVFTLNNPSVDDEEQINRIVESFRYCIIGNEVGESGTPHLQGYFELNSPQRLSWCKKLLPRAHFETRKGTREQARDYCKKEGNWTEYGNWQAGGQGARNDLKQLIEAVKEDKPFLTIVDETPDLMARNLRFYDRLVAEHEKHITKEFRQVNTEVFIGDAGTGKSRAAREIDHDAFTVNPEDSFPFDGYAGEKTIIIDDFEGQLKYKHLLKILDGHQLRVNVKGSHRYARWTKIIITTNEDPAGWYSRGLTPALKRRLNSVTKFCNDEAGNTMPPQ